MRDHEPFTSMRTCSSKVFRSLLSIPLEDPKLSCMDITETRIGCSWLVKLHSLETGPLAASLCCPGLPVVVPGTACDSGKMWLVPHLLHCPGALPLPHVHWRHSYTSKQRGLVANPWLQSRAAQLGFMRTLIESL